MSQPVIQGCDECLPEDTPDWGTYVQGFEIVERVIDDSHFIVSLRQCEVCAQKFAWIFTEFIDWEEGDDAQYWNVVPITPEEAQELSARLESLTDDGLNWLGDRGQGRRSLARDMPTGEAGRIGWRQGSFYVRPGY